MKQSKRCRECESSSIYTAIVSAGGGAVGAGLIDAALAAARQMTDLGRWCIIAGPNLPQSDFERFAAETPGHVDLVRFRTDFRSLLTTARLSISQAGYNTVCDIQQAGCRSVLVPFASGGETEQTARAERLQRMGLAVVLPESTLSCDTMVTAINRALDPVDLADVPVLQLDGANRTAELLRDLLNKRSASQL